MSNILSEVHPELVAEWSDKNLPLTPDRITYGSNKVVWWKGACGHEWQTSVKARSNGENCPICSGARVIEGINDLATLKPELADESGVSVAVRSDFQHALHLNGGVVLDEALVGGKVDDEDVVGPVRV